MPEANSGTSQMPKNINRDILKSKAMKELNEITLMREEIKEVKEDVRDVKNRLVEVQTGMNKLLLAVQQIYPQEVNNSAETNKRVASHAAGSDVIMSTSTHKHTTIDCVAIARDER